MKYVRYLIAIAIILLGVLPAVLSQSLVNAATQMLIAVLFACAFNLLCGQGGMLSFGHAAYFGVGAFATIHAMGDGSVAGLLPTPMLPLAGACAGILVGIGAGWFSTKRSGVYFSMITLALAELLHSLAPHLKGMFGGEAGISGMRSPAWGLSFGTSTQIYYLTLVWVLTSLAVLFLFTRTPVGRLTLALRENTHRLRFLGYEVHRLRVLVFVISAMFAGIAGSLQVINNESANYVVFDSHLSTVVVLNSYIGGVNVFLGPALGAAIMTFFGYAVSDLTRSWLLYQGILFVFVMMFLPSGLSGLRQLWLGVRRTLSVSVLIPIVALSCLAGLMLIGGVIFSVEILQRIFSQDYQSLLVTAGSAAWPSVSLFGRDWLPGSLFTWIVPLVLVIGGGILVKVVRRKFHTLNEATATPDTEIPLPCATEELPDINKLHHVERDSA